MPDDLKNAYSLVNLSRAWRWINSSPEYRYKNYFRDSYTAYAINIDENLKDLSFRLKDNKFEASEPSKMYVPKPSGILRPFTLLTIEDQIVYQSFINIIAEYQRKKTKGRYDKVVFGNLYAGKTSIFFYKKWINSYKRMNRAIREAHKEGYNYIASFDLTACYDSIDHKVIEYFLGLYGLDQEFIQCLSSFLHRWTSNGKISHGHGIPQGPLSSGLLSETVLSYLDEKYENDTLSKQVKYYRYVDDIRILAKDEISLQLMLMKLDFYSKQIGLFPQSSKINIHEITCIGNEIKAISIPFDFEGSPDPAKQKGVESKLLGLIHKNKIIDLSTFKRVLVLAIPNYKLTVKLLKFLSNNPSIYENVGFYLLKCKGCLSAGIVVLILDLLKRPETYQVVNARLLEILYQKVSDKDRPKVASFVKLRWQERQKNKIYYPYFRAILISWLLTENDLEFKIIKKLFEDETNWWVLKTILKFINKDFIGDPSYVELMRICLEKESVDVSLSAAHEIIKSNLSIKCSTSKINYLAQKTLRFSGVIKRASKTPSVIGKCLSSLTKKNLPDFNWKRFFGKEHNEVEKKFIRAQGYQNDISPLVSILDVLNDLLLKSLYNNDKSLGTYQPGNIGGVLGSKSRLSQTYPHVFTLCSKVHEKRLECDLSHPFTKRTLAYTRPIEYKYIYTLRLIIEKAYVELITDPLCQNSCHRTPRKV